MPEAIAKTSGSKRPAKTIGTDAVKKAKAKQTDLPGMEDRNIAEIEQAAETYTTHRDNRLAVGKLEKDAKTNLIAVMKKHNRDVYSYNGLEINVSHVDDVKVKAPKKGDDDDDE